MIGDIRELEGLRGEHVLLLDDAEKFAITRSKPMIAETLARMVNAQTMVPEIYDIPAMTQSQLASLEPTHVLFAMSEFEGFKGFGLEINGSIK